MKNSLIFGLLVCLGISSTSSAAIVVTVAPQAGSVSTAPAGSNTISSLDLLVRSSVPGGERAFSLVIDVDTTNGALGNLVFPTPLAGGFALFPNGEPSTAFAFNGAYASGSFVRSSPVAATLNADFLDETPGANNGRLIPDTDVRLARIDFDISGLNAATYPVRLFADAQGLTGALQSIVNNGQLTLTAIPEPTSLSLLAFAGLGICVRRRRMAAR